MSLSLLPTTRPALAYGRTTPFVASGGMGPFTYSVLPGGAGGSISGSGVYTAPNVSGLDTVLVVDSLGARATAPVLIGTPLELVCDILQTEMGLGDGRVVLWDQKFNSPNDQDLYIAVGVLNVKPFATNNRFDATLGQIQSVNVMATLSVDIISRGPAARDRKEEVLLALISYYSEQQQELNSFKVFPISSNFVNLSNIDGAAIPYRFNISVNVQYFVTKTKALPFYDDFSPVGVTTEA